MRTIIVIENIAGYNDVVNIKAVNEFGQQVSSILSYVSDAQHWVDEMRMLYAKDVTKSVDNDRDVV